MIPGRPDHSTPAAMSPVQPWTTNTPSAVMMRKIAAATAPYSEQTSTVRNQPRRGTRVAGDYPGDEDRSANCPPPAQADLQSVIESRSKLGMEWVAGIMRFL